MGRRLQSGTGREVNTAGEGETTTSRPFDKAPKKHTILYIFPKLCTTHVRTHMHTHSTHNTCRKTLIHMN